MRQTEKSSCLHGYMSQNEDDAIFEVAKWFLPCEPEDVLNKTIYDIVSNTLLLYIFLQKNTSSKYIDRHDKHKRVKFPLEAPKQKRQVFKHNMFDLKDPFSTNLSQGANTSERDNIAWQFQHFWQGFGTSKLKQVVVSMKWMIFSK